jgi:hypothetical protein
LPTAKKASESPRFQPDKNICDSGDELDTKEKKKNLQPTRLNFEAEKIVMTKFNQNLLILMALIKIYKAIRLSVKW